MNRKLTIDEQLHELKHNQKVIIQSLEQIKKHIWNDEGNLEEPAQGGEENNIKYQEQQAIHYIHNILIPDLAQKESEKGDMVAESVWIEWAAKPFIEYLKTQALIWIGKALEELKAQIIPLAVDIADYALEQLENLILTQYQKADDNQKQIFKNKIQEKFPNSRLLGKLN